MPQNAFVGLITFGAMCHVHELGFTQCPKAYVFRGTKEPTVQELQTQLGIAARHDPRGAAGSGAPRRFLLPVSQCEFAINSILDDLQRDAWLAPADHRPARCVGVALSIAVGLLELACAQQSGRVMLLLGGACTVGPGLVVEPSLSENLRHHADIAKETQNARHVKKSLKYYTAIANRAVAAGHAIDIFACSLDQCGLYEMKVCADKTGGYVVMSDTFSMNVFKDSFKRVFEVDSQGSLPQGYNAKIEILCSREAKVCGAVGACSGTGKKGTQVGETTVGEGNTCEWALGTLDKATTLAFYFEVTNQNANNLPSARQAFLQFQTRYHHPSGRRRLRVSTVSYRYAEPSIMDIASGFDQEAAAVLIARLAVFKTESEEPLDVLRWLDRKLIRLVSRFADYTKDDANSFHLGPEFTIFPQFMYHLRRSQFLQTFNASPDETAYYRSVLLRENLMHSLVMIQPALLEYSFADTTPQPVLLDVKSLRSDVILLCDSYFHVIIWHGEQIHQWKEQGYQDQPQYEYFARMLQAPVDDAREIIDERFPAPKYIVCNAGGSQARFLLAKVNPSSTHNNQVTGGFGGVDGIGVSGLGSVVITDDVSMSVFMQHLIKLAVQS
eukprot:CAMPEP_0113845098 /NCGR_PEP_ID=MMETSP0372-20130328/576_1 /TAXON_ID=340204 /ORGANISM="Lankesteria abbotti" /LENGTH=611 /DNA_ID=CAMNT_0000814119 /DNA_START=536 /DNA_END=2371 /DNA_ORIENTATION=- /assembly_acc=CAM_ASM_000359